MKKLISPPPDQAIVDNYFKLQQLKGYASAAWLYGMIATYGLNLPDFKNFKWNKDKTLTITTKKHTIKPLHPQWVFLFQLKEKQPSNLEDCFEKISNKLFIAMASQKMTLNLTDLQLSYRLRKSLYAEKKQDRQKKYLSSAVPYAR